MRAIVLVALLAACGPHNEPAGEKERRPDTVPPPSAVPASPRIPAEQSPPVATTDPPGQE